MRIVSVAIVAITFISCDSSIDSPLLKGSLLSQSYCSEVVFASRYALANHLTKTASDLSKLYSTALKDLQNARLKILETLQPEEIDRIRNELAQKHENRSKPIELSEESFCSDFEEVETYFQDELSQIILKKKKLDETEFYGVDLYPSVYHEFLDRFLGQFDYFSRIDLQNSLQGSDQSFGFSVQMTHEWHNSNDSKFLEVFAANRDISLKPGDRIYRISSPSSEIPSESQLRTIQEWGRKHGNLKRMDQWIHQPEKKYLLISVIRNHQATEESVLLEAISERPVPVSQSLMQSNGILITRLSRFESSTANEVIQTWKSYGTNLPNGLILDLRANGGGQLDEAFTLMSALAGKRDIGFEQSRENIRTLKLEPSDSIFSQPLIILVNHQTASAAEILARFLQSLGRAAVLGETTFGKGIAQSGIWLPNLRAAVRLTTDQYFDTLGKPVQVLGVNPDLSTSSPSGIFRMKDMPQELMIPPGNIAESLTNHTESEPWHFKMKQLRALMSSENLKSTDPLDMAIRLLEKLKT